MSQLHVATAQKGGGRAGAEEDYSSSPETCPEALLLMQDLEAALASLQMGRPGTQQPLVFICGPPAMTEALNTCLLKLGLDAMNIRFERWW